jgi:hypothetical protein
MNTRRLRQTFMIDEGKKFIAAVETFFGRQITMYSHSRLEIFCALLKHQIKTIEERKRVHNRYKQIEEGIMPTTGVPVADKAILKAIKDEHLEIAEEASDLIEDLDEELNDDIGCHVTPSPEIEEEEKKDLLPAEFIQQIKQMLNRKKGTAKH